MKTDLSSQDRLLTGQSDGLHFIYITGDPRVASTVIRAGVDWVMVDLETLGKQERQAGRSTWISSHTLVNVEEVVSAVTPSRVIVRTDPLHENSMRQINDVLAAGARILMQPMYESLHDVEAYLRIIDGRADAMPLAETSGAVHCFDKVTKLPEIRRVHIGLNDLAISLGQEFLFQPLCSGHLDRLSAIATANGVAFGFGGVARIGEGVIPAELILCEHVRLASTAVILSRTFRDGDGSDDVDDRNQTFVGALAHLRAEEDQARNLSPESLDLRNTETKRLIEAEVQRRTKLL